MAVNLDEKHRSIHSNKAAVGVATLPRSRNLQDDAEIVNHYKERLATWAQTKEGAAFLERSIGAQEKEKLVAALRQSDGQYDDKKSTLDLRRAVELFQRSQGGKLKVDETIGWRTDFALERVLTKAKTDIAVNAGGSTKRTEVAASKLPTAGQPDQARKDPAESRATLELRDKPRGANSGNSTAESPRVTHVDGGVPRGSEADKQFVQFLKGTKSGNVFVQQAQYQREQRELTAQEMQWWRTKIGEFEKIRGVVTNAHAKNPAVDELIKRIGTASPLTPEETQRYSLNIRGYERIADLHDNMMRLSPSYRNGSDPIARYLENWNDRSKVDLKVVADKNGDIDYIDFRRLGGNEPIVRFRDNPHYEAVEGKHSGGVATWSGYQGLHDKIELKLDNSYFARNSTNRSGVEWLADAIRHERAHYFGGDESNARDAEFAFQKHHHSKKFVDVITHAQSYNRLQVAHTIVEHYLDHGPLYVVQNGKNVPNPEIASWLGGPNYQTEVSRVKSNYAQFRTALKPTGGQATTPDEAEQKFLTVHGKQFSINDPEVRDGIIAAFVGKAIDPIADQYREIPLLSAEEQKARAAQYEKERAVAEKQGRAEAEKFLTALKNSQGTRS